MALGPYGSRHLPLLVSLYLVRKITIGSRVVSCTARHMAPAFVTPTETTVPVESLASENASCSVLTEILAPTHWTDCYQCGKCTAGCPVAAGVDMAPNQIVRALQLGNFEKAMTSDVIWTCVSCQTCSTRCPQSVDCAGIMDALREVSLRSGLASPEQKTVVAFQQAFLNNIRRNGRLDEIELIAEFKLRALPSERSLRFLFKDAGLAPQLQKRHKLHLRGEKVKDRAVVRRIFERCGDGKHA
jgi:heterodisulfide reductase subunit C